MAQILGRRRDRRNSFHTLRRFPGQHRRRAVYLGIRDPAFGGSDQPAGNFGAPFLRQFTDYILRSGIPGQGRCAGREIAFAGYIEERRQQALIAHLIGGDELRDFMNLNCWLAG